MERHSKRTATVARRAALALLAVASVAPATTSAAEKKYQKIKAPALRSVALPQVTRLTLDNGLQIFMVEDHELPLFRLRLTMKGGSAHEPAEQVGLASIAAGVLRSGGSEALPGDRMDEVLESMGGAIETNVEPLATVVSANVLIEDMDKALAMLRDLLLLPAYPQDKIDLELKQTRSAIARRNDDPGEIAGREMDKILYGADHPFGRSVEYATLDRISRDDLVAWHKKYFHPTDAYLAVWGDFSAPQATERLRNVLGEWPRAEVAYPEIPPVPATTASIHLASKESINQSSIRIGHRGTTQKDPDYYALAVMNEVLGGSFGSRLFNEVRSSRGLAYGVGSGLGAGLTYPGMFQITCGTKSASTVDATRACIDEVRKMKTQAVTAAELDRAKSGILNSDVFKYTDKGAIVNRQITYVRNGYPADFPEKFAAGIGAVTVEDVKRAADKYLQPDQLAILVVGNPAGFGTPLAALGTVQDVDITIPAPAVHEEYPAATPESLARGQEILVAASTASGGVANLKKVTQLTENAALTLTMMGQSISGKMTRYAQYPGAVRSEMEFMGQKIVQMYDPKSRSGFQSSGGRSKDFETSDVEEAEQEIARDRLGYLRDGAAYAPQWIGETDVKGAIADVVLMSPATGPKFKVFVDRKTHHVVKEEYRGKNIEGAPVREELFLEDYRKVGAVTMPHRTTILQDGQPFLEGQTQSYSLEPIPADKFKKSAS